VAHGSSQYLLPDQLEVADVSRALGSSVVLRAGSRGTEERSFYDTFDGRLHRAGLSLIHEDGRLVLLDGGYRERAGADSPRSPEHLVAADLPAGRLRNLLVPLVELRALTRIARVRSRRRPLRVLDDEGKTVVWLVLEEPGLVGVGDGSLRPRLNAVAVRGYDKALARVCGRLEAELGLAAVASLSRCNFAGPRFPVAVGLCGDHLLSGRLLGSLA
jgi:hypothetical protein